MIVAVIGATALYLLFIWLASAILASIFSGEKGYGERPGLASGLLLSLVGATIWLWMPPKAGSDWREAGPTTSAVISMGVMLVLGVAVPAYGMLSDQGTAFRVVVLAWGLASVVGAVVAFVTAPRRREDVAGELAAEG